mmetsp:Transcript_38783/g.67211  ORF Transcript_38783/g.67211 Transcript_38783/m.67211 type:complete len:86 (-) Transcript_38783:386-643(-)
MMQLAEWKRVQRLQAAIRLGFPQRAVGPPIYWITHNNRVAVYMEVGGEVFLFVGYADDNGFTILEGGGATSLTLWWSWLLACLSQ